MLRTFVTLLAATASALNPIAVRDNVFYDTGTNERFYMIGIDYQPGGAAAVEAGADPLSDINVCRRDVFLFQQLGVNTVRVYSVDNQVNHDACMSLYNAAGIYLILDVNSPLEGQHLNRYEPWTTYNSIYATHVFKTIEAFAGYPNTLGFFSGNELINDDRSAFASAPYIKAITRDMKDYIRKYLDRPIPVGYSAADDIKFRIETATYMSCGTDSVGLNDFYAINSYQWCGQQTLQTSGYDILIQQFSNFTLPLFFSEYGCNEVRPRSFQEVGAVYSSPMTEKFSGGLVYEFSQEDNNYGLVDIASNGDVRLRSDFVALQGRYRNISSLPRSIPSAQVAAPSCPPASSYQYLNGSLTVPRLAEIQRVIDSRISTNVVRGALQSSVDLSGTSNTIQDVGGSAISNKRILQASSRGSVPNLRTLFPSSSGVSTRSGSAAAASSAASNTSRSGAAQLELPPGLRLAAVATFVGALGFVVL